MKLFMAKKFKIEEEIPEFEEEETCDRCGAEGAADFNTERLCMNCVAQDVFEDYE